MLRCSLRFMKRNANSTVPMNTNTKTKRGTTGAMSYLDTIDTSPCGHPDDEGVAHRQTVQAQHFPAARFHIAKVQFHLPRLPRLFDPVFGIKFFGAPPAIMEAALDEATQQGLRSACHHAQMAVTRVNVLDTARWGLTSMEHWYGLPEALFTDQTVQDYPLDYNYANELDRFGQAGQLWKQAAGPGSGHYLQFLEQETVSAYEHLAGVLQSERCASLEDELERFVAAGPAAEMRERHGGLSIRRCAEQFVRPALVKLLDHGDAIDADAPARQLHKLRIEAKRFRYLLDFFSTVQADEWLAVTDAVKKLQDVLGEHQDAVTAKAQLANYTATLSSGADASDQLAAAAHLMHDAVERIDTSRQQFTAAWSEFKSLVA